MRPLGKGKKSIAPLTHRQRQIQIQEKGNTGPAAARPTNELQLGSPETQPLQPTKKTFLRVRRHDNTLKKGSDARAPSLPTLGFHPPSTACQSTVDTPMLHRHLNLCRRVSTTAPPPPPASLHMPPPTAPRRLSLHRPLPPPTRASPAYIASGRSGASSRRGHLVGRRCRHRPYL